MTGNRLQASPLHDTRAVYIRLRSHDDRFPGYAPNLLGIVEQFMCWSQEALAAFHRLDSAILASKVKEPILRTSFVG
jgi:hypothetical protein